MKTMRDLLFASVLTGTSAFLISCGEDAEEPTPADKEDNSTTSVALGPPRQSAPSAPLLKAEPSPLPEWIGPSSEFAVTFEELYDNGDLERTITVEVELGEKPSVVDAEPETEERIITESVERLGLRVRANASLYTGRITRLGESGEAEFRGTFRNGYLEGMAYWWDDSGSLVRVVEAVNGLMTDLEIGEVKNPAERILAEA
ncbi:uncharacterized protein METZ01_LOCUS471001, partial [marine metagenome]